MNQMRVHVCWRGLIKAILLVRYLQLELLGCRKIDHVVSGLGCFFCLNWTCVSGVSVKLITESESRVQILSNAASVHFSIILLRKY